MKRFGDCMYCNCHAGEMGKLVQEKVLEKCEERDLKEKPSYVVSFTRACVFMKINITLVIYKHTPRIL